MEGKIIEADFTATPEEEIVEKKSDPIVQSREFLDRLFKWIDVTIREYNDFPLQHLLESLNTVSMTYLLAINNVDDQRRFLEWMYKRCMVKIDEVAKLKAEAKKQETV